MNILPDGEKSTMGFEPRLSNSTNVWDQGWPQSFAEFEMLVEVYSDRLVLSAFRRLGNFQDAEDAVQEVFVHAFVERKKRKKISHVGPYLYRMTINSCTDMMRKQKHTGGYLESLQADEISNGQINPSEMVAAVEELHRVEELLRQLPKAQAEVIRLRVFDELRLSEIAEVVGCSMNTVSSRLRYGFKKLRKIVSREHK
ncbi:RNA polymerase sigma factor [Candidatus Latescibacterota bacterium]